MDLEKVLLKPEYFIQNGRFEVFPPVHPLVLERGLDLDLAYSCLDSAVKQTLGKENSLMAGQKSDKGIVVPDFPIHRARLIITQNGLEFGLAEDFNYERCLWPTNLKLTKEVITEYELIQEQDGTINFTSAWASHNLEGDSRKDFCFNFALEYANALVRRKYSG